MTVCTKQSGDGGQRLLTVSDYGHVCLHVLVNLAAVNVKVDNLSLLGVCLHVARNAVAKPHADGNEDIALLFFLVYRIVTMHAQHADIEWMVRGQCREPKHGTASRYVGLLKKRLQLFLCITQFNALSYQCQWLAGIIDKFGSLTHCLSIEFRIRHVTANEIYLLRFPVNLFSLRIFRKVKHDGTWTACTCNVKSTADGPSHILGTANLVRPFRDRLSHANEVNLLEGISTQSSDRHLASNNNNGCRVKHGISNACQRIGHTRTTGH